MLKVILFYNQGPHGWTETWYANGNTPPYDLTTPVKNLVQKAVDFRAPFTSIEWIRFSVVGKPQLVNSFRLSDKFASGLVETTTPDVVSTDAIWKMISATFTRRTIQLRGLPDAAVTRDTQGHFLPTANLTAGVDAYLKQVQNVGWLIRGSQNPRNSDNPKFKVVKLLPDPANPTITTVTTDGPITARLAATHLVKFSGKVLDREIPGFPRQAKTVSEGIPDPNSFQINYTMPSPIVTGYKPASLYATSAEYSYELLYDWDFQSLSSRQTGRPFGALRGRRSAAFSRN